MKVLIVEDNRSAVNVIKRFLDEFPEPLDICAVGGSLEDAEQLTKIHHPDIFILDIRLQDELIFPLFDKLNRKFFSKAQIIFTTAYYEADYLYKALQHSALDYIVKPIEKEQLFSVLHQAIERLRSPDLDTRLNELEEQLNALQNQGKEVDRLPFKCLNGSIEYISMKKWVRIFTQDSVTRVQFIDGSFKATSDSLKHFESTLADNGPFFRISKQEIIHLKYLKKFDPRDKSVSLTTGYNGRVARRRASCLLERLEKKG